MGWSPETDQKLASSQTTAAMQPLRNAQSGRMHWLLLLLALLSFTSLTAASTPTSFCKCTCFSNSTIIPLDPAKSGSDPLDSVVNLYHRAFDHALTDSDSSESGPEQQAAPQTGDRDLSKRANRYRQLNCNDCNRKFCLDYELPTCKGAKEDDVVTTCFQRDSRKDETVVFIFIFATGGLLAWALCKPWIERYLEAARERRSYMPVSEDR